METILLISLLVGGTLLLLIALLYILYKCFTKRKAREVDNSLCEVVVDGVDHDKKVLGPQPIFNVTSSYNEILSEDKISVGDSFREEHSDRDTSHEVRTRYSIWSARSTTTINIQCKLQLQAECGHFNSWQDFKSRRQPREETSSFIKSSHKETHLSKLQRRQGC